MKFVLFLDLSSSLKHENIQSKKGYKKRMDCQCQYMENMRSVHSDGWLAIFKTMPTFMYKQVYSSIEALCVKPVTDPNTHSFYYICPYISNFL